MRTCRIGLDGRLLCPYWDRTDATRLQRVKDPRAVVEESRWIRGNPPAVETIQHRRIRSCRLMAVPVAAEAHEQTDHYQGNSGQYRASDQYGVQHLPRLKTFRLDQTRASVNSGLISFCEWPISASTGSGSPRAAGERSPRGQSRASSLRA